MGSVVEFLSTLSTDESHSNVRRTLNICVEFERISKMALVKAEKEMRGRGKRAAAQKAGEGDGPTKSIVEQQIEAQASYRQPVQTPSLRAASLAAESTKSTPSPGVGSDQGRNRLSVPSGMQHGRSLSQANINDQTSQNHSPARNGMGNNVGKQPSPIWSNEEWANNNMTTPSNGFYPHTAVTSTEDYVDQHNNQNGAAAAAQAQQLSDDMAHFTDADIASMTNGNTFNQPFVPQDLWQMPMTLEWDWSDAGMVGPDMNIGMGSASLYDFANMGGGMDMGGL